MADEYDEFSDILGDNDEGGVFAGSGHKNFENVRQTTQADGVKVELQCRSCGKPAAVVMEWPELFIIGTNGPNVPVLLPPGYQLSQNNKSVFTAVNCPKCSKPSLAVHVTPDEAARHVNTAMKMGLMNPAQVEQLKAFVRSQRGM